MLKTNDDLDFERYLLTYKPTEAWLNSANKTAIDYEGEVYAERFSGTINRNISTAPCPFSLEPVWMCAWGAAHPPGFPGCNGGNYIVTFQVVEHCSPVQGGGGSISNPDGTDGTENGGSGSGGGSSTGPDNNLPLDGIITEVVVNDFRDNMTQIRQCLGSNLTVDDQAWLSQQTDEFVQELAGLMNNCNPASSPYESIWEAVEYLFAQNQQMEINFIKDKLYTDEEIEITYEEYIDFVELHHFTDSERAIYENELNYYERFEYLHSGLIAKQHGILIQPSLLTGCRNGNGDAIQHAMWNAIGEIYIGTEKMKRLTEAHEEENLINYPLESEMDLFNNQVGLDANVNLFNVTFVILQKFESGKLRKLSHLQSNASCNYTANSVLISTP